MKKHATNSKEELKKMEKDAVLVFATGSGLVFAAAMYYSYVTGNILCFEILIGVVIFLAVFLSIIFRPKNRKTDSQIPESMNYVTQTENSVTHVSK